MCSTEKGREFFGKEWFSGMPYSSSNLQGMLCSEPWGEGEEERRWEVGRGREKREKERMVGDDEEER